MRGLAKAREAVRRARDIVLACHINPDGDAIGSMLGLGLGLRQQGKHIVMLSPDGIPRPYRSLPGAGLIRRRPGGRPKRFDLGIAVDCSYPHMLGPALKTVRAAPRVIAFDHHLEREAFGPGDVVDIDAGAVGEVVYRFLRVMKVTITKEIAENLLTSVIVETNSYRLPSVRPETFLISARLSRTGVDFSRLTERVYWAVRKEAAVLMGICLSRGRFLKNGQAAWTIIRLDDLKRIGGTPEDVDRVPDELRSVQGVKVAVFFRETDQGYLRVSLRSKGRINIGALARRFGGGGHYDVAGCFIANNRKSREEFLKRVLELVP